MQGGGDLLIDGKDRAAGGGGLFPDIFLQSREQAGDEVIEGYLLLTGDSLQLFQALLIIIGEHAVLIDLPQAAQLLPRGGPLGDQFPVFRIPRNFRGDEPGLGLQLRRGAAVPADILKIFFLLEHGQHLLCLGQAALFDEQEGEVFVGVRHGGGEGVKGFLPQGGNIFQESQGSAVKAARPRRSGPWSHTAWPGC